MGKICFIILHYNAYAETCQCVDSILDLEEQEDIEIVLIDNASDNDSYSELGKRYQREKVHLLKNEKNLGFSKANNRAYEYAKDRFSIDFVVFANNDVSFVQRDFVKRIREEYKRSHFALLGPDVYTPRIDLHVSPISRDMLMPMRELKMHILKGKIGRSLFPLYYLYLKVMRRLGKCQEVVYDVKLEYQENVLLSGSCIICSKELLQEKEKIFSPETYFYYEEYILAYWCYLHQKKIVFQPEMQILHFGGVATALSHQGKEKMKFVLKYDTDSAEVYLNLRKKYQV